jgi:GxxExxY protein
MVHELRKLRLAVTTQECLPIAYDGIKIDVGYRLDVVIEDSVILELKAIDALAPIHTAQMLSYLKLSGKKLGLLMNFHVLHMKDGIKRIVNGL